jgi:hypothetical protein
MALFGSIEIRIPSRRSHAAPLARAGVGAPLRPRRKSKHDIGGFHA